MGYDQGIVSSVVLFTTLCYLHLRYEQALFQSGHRTVRKLPYIDLEPLF
jgi:hypothetical protein